MTLSELSAAWNELRNAALGRGTAALVSPALADEISDAYESFRAWLAEQGPSADLAASVTASEWVELYRELAADVRAELPDAQFRALATTPVERAQSAVDTGRSVLFVAAVAGAVALVFLRRRR